MKNSTTFLKVLTGLLVSVFSALFIGQAVASEMHDFSLLFPVAISVFVIGIIASLGVVKVPGMLCDSIDISALNTALGAYFRKDKDQIFMKMLLGMDIGHSFDEWDDCKDEVVLPQLGITDLVKPADDLNFTPTSNAIQFGARIAKVRRWKVDLLIVPGQLEKSWLGKYKKKGSDAFDIPLEQYIMNYIIAKVQENIRMKALYKGVYNASGTTPTDIFNGILKIIADELTAGSITAVVTGAITSANVIDKMLLVYDGLDEAYKNTLTNMPVNSTIFDWAIRKFNPILNTSLISTDTQAMQNGGRINQFPLPGTNCVVVREPGLQTSQRIHVTTPDNKIYMTDSMGEENNIKIQEFERSLKLMIDAKGGVDFKQVGNYCLRVNDQA
jgi:hypothetical protein